MRRSLALLALAATMATAAPAYAQQQQGAPADRAAAPTMASLLTGLRLPFAPPSGDNHWYVANIALDANTNISLGLMEVRDWLDEPGLVKGRIEVPILTLHAAPTPQLLKAVAAMANDMRYGGLVADETGVYYIHDFIMNGMTGDSFKYEVLLAAFQSKKAKADLSAYAEEE